MDKELKQCGISEEDIRAGLTDLKGFVDITEEDLMKIYSSALRHARNRSQSGMTVAHLMTKDVVTVKKDTPLEEAARRTKSISQTPPPMVRQTALADFYVEYRLVAYTPAETPEQRVDVLNQLHANIQDVFNEHGVQIMSPHYMMDPNAPQVVPRSQWYAAPARAPGSIPDSL